MAKTNTVEATPIREPIDELVGRFQVANEKAIQALEAKFIKSQADTMRQVGALTDQVQAMREEQKAMVQLHEETKHRVAVAERECNTALREAVKQATIARGAAETYEKIREARPILDEAITKIRRDIGEIRDRMLKYDADVQLMLLKAETLSTGYIEVKTNTESYQRMMDMAKTRTT